MKIDNFKHAFQLLISNEGSTLVHGVVAVNGGLVSHAWCETDDGHVWEPEEKKTWRKDDFYRFVKTTARYTKDEAQIEERSRRDYGPWAKAALPEKKVVKKPAPRLTKATEAKLKAWRQTAREQLGVAVMAKAINEAADEVERLSLKT